VRAHRLKGTLFAYYPTEKFRLAYAAPESLDSFIVPPSPPGFVLRVQPHGASAVETSSLAFAEQLARGARGPVALITFGPKDTAP
jgi:hypothetical protein